MEKADIEEVFVRKEWAEEGMVIYLHFVDDWAVRQIDERGDKAVLYSERNPTVGDLSLCDARLSDMPDLTPDDYISKAAFEKTWRAYGGDEDYR